MIGDLVLVQPPQRGLLDGFSNGLIDLANFVYDRCSQTEVSILDFGLTPVNRILEGVQSHLTKLRGSRLLVGITTTTASYRSALAVARAFKAAAPECKVGLGGHHASPQHDIVLKYHSDIVDLVFRGEGEYSLLSATRDPLEKVPGISYLRNGHLHVNPPKPLLTTRELDTLNVDFQGQTFQLSPGKFDHATYVSARGCPLSCSFCAVAGESVRAKSVPRVIHDLRYLVLNKGYRRIAIEDNFFAQSRKRTLELCTALADLRKEIGPQFVWDCQTRVESLRNPEILDKLSAAGCEAVYLGVEAVNPAELTFLGKTPQPESYLELLEDIVIPNILRRNMGCYINLQVGLPAEDSVSREERILRLSRLGRIADRQGMKITIFPQLHVVYPGTTHFWKSVERVLFGYLGLSVFEHFTEWENENEPIREFLGQNFAHGIGGIPIGVLDSLLLAKGTFEMCRDSVKELRSHLDEIENLRGVSLFKYGSYLAGQAVNRGGE